MEDYFKDSFSSNVGGGDKRYCHYEGEKCSPTSVILNPPNDAT